MKHIGSCLFDPRFRLSAFSLSACLLFTLFALLCGYSRAQDATVIPFQGQLANQAGQPLSPTNAVTLVFRLYTAPVAGTAIWEESQPNVSVNAGRFSVLLGSRTQLPAQSYFNSTLYLGITVDDGNPQTADVEMRPRQALVPVISARFAQNADKLRGYDWSVLFGTNNPVDGKIEGSKIANGTVQGQQLAEPLQLGGDLSISGDIKLSTGVGSYGAGRIQVSSTGDLIGLTLNSASRVWDLISVTSGSFDYFAIRDHTADALRLLVDEHGRVGLGKTPQEQLDVAGTVKATTFQGDGVVPTGSVMAYMGTTPPPGWRLCDGAPVSRTEYSALFAIIRTTSGVGDGVNTFNLPDLRGYFLRGRDAAQGRDPDSTDRFAINGGNAGDAVGSVQNDVFASHNHGYDGNNNTSGGTYLNFGSNQTTDTNWRGVTGNSGGRETRPKNVNVNYIIKY